MPHEYKEARSGEKHKCGKSIKFDFKTQDIKIMSFHATSIPNKDKIKISLKNHNSEQSSANPS